MTSQSFGRAAAGALAFCFATIGAAGAGQSERAEKHVTVDQAIGCLKAAVSSRAGQIRDLEVDIKDGRTICEVKVVGANGKRSEVDVDAATFKVLKVDD